MDASTRLQVLSDIEKYELLGEFDKHIDPVDMSIALPVNEDFPYIPKGFLRVKYAVERAAYVNPFRRKANKEILRTQVYGKENLKGVKAAIVTCNHVHKFDCLAVQYAAKGHKTYIIGAKFNNMKGFMGEMMRAGGLLPLSDSMGAMKNLNKAISEYLKKGCFVTCYPEQAMWWNYEKPRPFKDGAFSLAAINNVPIVPMFITFRSSGKYDDNGIEIKYFSVHIMKPIYPKEELPRRKNVDYMRDENYRLCCEKYEEIYGKKLEYTTKKGSED
ncbi:MAG: 1-acyl-sn-glycerol-3-phosphate acyltransferase [Clostridia bacterium]|nr:1-acyl-sn-glycerol-3-phosphate acyltransferase [Clostridia bacterium]